MQRDDEGDGVRKIGTETFFGGWKFRFEGLKLSSIEHQVSVAQRNNVRRRCLAIVCANEVTDGFHDAADLRLFHDESLIASRSIRQRRHSGRRRNVAVNSGGAARRRPCRGGGGRCGRSRGARRAATVYGFFEF